MIFFHSNRKFKTQGLGLLRKTHSNEWVFIYSRIKNIKNTYDLKTEIITNSIDV